MGIEGGGGGRVVSQVVLDETEIHPRFKQVRGPRVAERVHRGALVDAAGLQGCRVHQAGGPGDSPRSVPGSARIRDDGGRRRHLC